MNADLATGGGDEKSSFGRVSNPEAAARLGVKGGRRRPPGDKEA
jgi:hypothetical protein